jgi:hypothetical protein
MKAEKLAYYLDILSKAKDKSEKDKIFLEIDTLVKLETSEERAEGIESIRNAVENIAQRIESKLVLQH